MTTQYNSGRGSTIALLPLLFALLLGAGSVVFLLRHPGTGLASRLAAWVAGTPATTDVSAPAVVEKIQRLSRLETVTYSIDTVVEGEHRVPPIPDMLTGDKILLVVHGQTIAGIDLAKLRAEDVRIDPANPHSIQVNLPQSEIFVTALDNGRTRVYARTTGLLGADLNLESSTRAKAQEQVQAAALGDGILDVARKNARATISALLFALGFTHVDVT